MNNRFFLWFAQDVTGADLSAAQVGPQDDADKLVSELLRLLTPFQFGVFESALRQLIRYATKAEELFSNW